MDIIKYNIFQNTDFSFYLSLKNPKDRIEKIDFINLKKDYDIYIDYNITDNTKRIRLIKK